MNALDELLATLTKRPDDAPPPPPPGWSKVPEPPGETCPVCRKMIDPAAGNVHPGCDASSDVETVSAVATLTEAGLIEHEPPSTVDYMHSLLVKYDATRPRSIQKAVGPSELGTTCRRQLAYKIANAHGLAEIPEHDDGSPWAALQGVAMHALMEDVLAFDNSIAEAERFSDGPLWTIEGEVVVTDDIKGHSDAFWLPHATVVDWKYTGKSTIGKVLTAQRAGKPPRDQISPTYRGQAHLYGFAAEQAGREVKWVRVVFLARDADYWQSAEWTERYNPELADWYIKRYYALLDQIRDMHLDQYPGRWEAIEASPGDACKFCPFKRPGGAADGTGCPGNTADQYATAARRLGVGLVA